MEEHTEDSLDGYHYSFNDSEIQASTPRTYTNLEPVSVITVDLANDKLSQAPILPQLQLQKEVDELRSKLEEKNTEIKSLKDHIEEQTQLFNGNKLRRKADRPDSECQKAVRLAYNTLKEADDSASFMLSGPWSMQLTIVKRLRKEIFNLYGKEKWGKLMIKEACQTYFRSLKEDECRKRNNLFKHHRDCNRRKQRMRRKLRQREVGMIHLDEEDKGKVAEILSLDFMSSDEDTEGLLPNARALTWESEELKELKTKMDKKFLKHSTYTVKRATKGVRRGVMGVISNREAPVSAPVWAVKK